MNVKLIFVIYSEDIDRQVMVLLKQAGISSYTLWERVLGTGSAGAKLGNEVGPGTNKMLMALVEEGRVKSLLERLTNLKKSFLRRQGLKTIVLPIDEVV